MAESRMVLANMQSTPLGNLMILREEGGDKRFMAIRLSAHDFKSVSDAFHEEKTVNLAPYTIMTNMATRFEATIEKVVINELTGGAYLVEMHLKKSDGQTIIVHSRPSDAVVIALMTKCPIFADTMVLEETMARSEQEIDGSQADWLANLDLSANPTH